jgi:hypothetical protein
MKFNISDEESRKAKIPHEIFLTNLVANHILWFIASLGMVKDTPQLLAMMPIFSFAFITFILWRAKKSKTIDSWFVMCHWQIAATRNHIFIIMLLFMLSIALLGWLGITYLDMKDVAAYAIIGGVGILPVMVTVLALIIMESDILHQATLHKLPDGVVEKFRSMEMPEVIEEAEFS